MTTYWTDKRVVVTGGAGFLGSHVAARLRQSGCKHIFVVRSREYDLTKEEAVVRLFRDLEEGKGSWRALGADGRTGVDIVIHLAGLVGGIGANKARPADFFYQNIMMGVLTMHYAWKAGAKRFVAAGAGCGYPEHAPIPLKEESFWDGYPQQESAPYALAKRMLHTQALAYWQQYGFPAIISIPGNVYGPHDNFDLENAHVIPALVRKFVDAVEDGGDQVVVWGTGRPTRDFVYAGDVAEGVLRAAEVYHRPELVNISSATETSIREVVQALVEITGFGGRILWDTSRPDGQLRRLFDVSKAKREMGFECRTNLRQGLQKTVEWYRTHRHEARTVVAYSGR